MNRPKEKLMYSYPYPRMLVTVDTVIFKVNHEGNPNYVLLIQRGNEPFKGRYAFPGGFPEMDELLVQAAKRELEEETGLKNIELRQIGAFDELDRDPRDRNIAIAFWGIAPPNCPTPKAGDDAAKAQWFKLGELPPLAFDHEKILKAALNCLKDYMSK
ncbi:MAG: 8-oxo-dGTP diphosphatase [Tenuifilum sp.]|nr:MULTISPECIES: NUDIX hydrolase [Tenuifilum]MDI3526711.1 8-oxo-dGTP diphosphatase [Tenuifilum sp.]